MRILHLINSLATGGAEQVVVQLAEEGIKRGHDVRILTLSAREGNPAHRARTLNIPVNSVHSEPNFFSVERAVRKAANKAEILHVHLFPSLYYGARFEGPKIFTEHNTTNRRRNSPLFSPFDRRAYQSYDALVGVSKGVTRNLTEYLAAIKLFDKRMATIYNGVPEFFLQTTRKLKERYTRLLIVGSMTFQKNHSLALQSLKLLPEMTLDVAGTGPLESQIRREARALNVENRVNFLGNVRDMSFLFANNDILLSTSTFEGFGLAVLEAQATGMPVVVPNVEGLVEVVRDGLSGRVFDGSSPEAIARIISEVSNPSTYENLSRGARVNASLFSMTRCASSYVELYTELA